jgi:hypothetical protein
MTYTFKLARRLAVSRRLVMLPIVLLLASCNGDATAPETGDVAGPRVHSTVTVNPKYVTVESNQVIRFSAYSRTRSGDSVSTPITWQATGGTILQDGRFSSATTGSFMVTGAVSRSSTLRGDEYQDTSYVKVVRRWPQLTSIEIAPESVTLTPGMSQSFLTTGRLKDGRPVPVGTIWNATGGTIDAGGNYVAGDTAGTYQVIAVNTNMQFSDTALVTITAPAPPPPPPAPSSPEEPAPIVAKLLLKPATTTLGPLATKQFAFFGRTSTGDSVPVSVELEATGGTVTPAALFTAPSTSGTFRLIARAGELADTSTVTVVAKVVLKPATATLAPLTTRQFTAFGRTSVGDSVPVNVNFEATGGTVTAAGLYTAGSTAGTFRVIATAGALADTSTLTITTPLGSGPVGISPSGACLAGSGPLVTLSTAAVVPYDTRTAPLAASTLVDARSGSWTGWSFPVNVASEPGLCWTGGTIQGTLPEETPWTTWHSTSALYVRGERPVVENVRADNYGDGVRFTTAGTTNWTLRGVHFTKMHDDCVENDRLESGLVEDVLLDGCYVAFSARPGATFENQVNGSQNTVTVRNSLVRLRRQVSVYKGESPSSGGFFKVENDLLSINLSWVLENNIFRADGPSGFATLCLNQHGKFTARNNIMVWLGQGDYPCALPAGWTLTRDPAVWDNAVAEWKARHPGL